MKILNKLFLILVVCFACNNKSTIYYKIANIETDNWHWSNTKSFTIEITDSTKKVNAFTMLRISKEYAYANLWLKYTITGTGVKEQNQFNIPIVDNNFGKYYGKGGGNVLNYENSMFKNKVLRPGKYQIVIQQNMRDANLQGVIDVGVKLEKGEPNF